MKLRVLGKDRIGIGIGAGLLALGLVAIEFLWPPAFGLFIAVGGTIGALMVLYEVTLTKRLAQAEFIRDLQTSFSSDANIGALWSKLLLNEGITTAERAMVSSYLTFFETLHLLIHKGALDLEIVDDLFRNRFFKAVGNSGILETVLIKEAGSFSNIHDLIAHWHDYLIASKIPIHSGYYGYIEALSKAKGYEIVRLHERDLADLGGLQEAVLRTLEDDSWLRANSAEMLEECLASHVTLGARCNGQLVAAAVLYDGGDSDESIKHYFTRDSDEMRRTINLKLVYALPEHRKRGLSRTLVELLEKEACELGKTEILCTIHPKNVPSQSLFKSLGYSRIGMISTGYGERRVFSRELPVINKRWAR